MRKRKRSSRKIKDKPEKQEERANQEMAIRSITNREKRKEDERSKSPKESSDTISNTTIPKEQELQDVKAGDKVGGETTFPEVFDSSRYDSMTEMKKSADMQEEQHLEEVLSTVEKEEPPELAITDIQTSNVNMNSSPTATTATDMSLPNLEEKAAELRGSKSDQMIDNSPADKKEGSQEELVKEEVKDKKEETESWLSDGLIDPYTIFWRDAAKSWTDFYVESASHRRQVGEPRIK